MPPIRETRAAVMRDFNAPLSLETVRLKEPRADQIVVRIAASGICHTDLSVVRGALPYPPPAVLGHEGAGVVEEVGGAVVGLEPGDHVVLSSIACCGRCAYCAGKLQHLCESGITAAMEGRQVAFEKDGDIGNFCGLGSFARHTVVDASQAVKIDRDVPLARACLIGCGVVTGVGAALNTARVQAGETVAVFGCGGVGVNVIQGAAIAGASRIIAVDVIGAKLEWAKQFGATDCVNVRGAEGDDASEQVRRVAGGLGVDVAFEAIGAPQVIRQAFLATRRGGKAIIVGVAPFGAEVALPACLLPLEERSLIGSLYGSAYMPRDVPKLVELYRRGKLKLDELVSKEIALDDINAGLEALEGGAVLRSVIRFE